VSVACLLIPEAEQTRFGLGAVAPTPLLVIDGSGVLTQAESAQVAKESALAKLAERATPISDVRASKEYRQAMLFALMRKAQHIASERLNHSRS
jgi:carbon-monoxide dehydrogenase medium subunit